MKLELPLPPSILNPNDKSHWAKKAKAKAACKLSAYYLCRAAKVNAFRGEVRDELTMTVEFRLPGKRKRDADNLLASAKASIDGVAQALDIDDCRFNPITVNRVYGQPQPGMMVIYL